MFILLKSKPVLEIRSVWKTHLVFTKLYYYCLLTFLQSCKARRSCDFLFKLWCLFIMRFIHSRHCTEWTMQDFTHSANLARRQRLDTACQLLRKGSSVVYFRGGRADVLSLLLICVLLLSGWLFFPHRFQFFSLNMALPCDQLIHMLACLVVGLRGSNIALFCVFSYRQVQWERNQGERHFCQCFNVHLQYE